MALRYLNTRFRFGFTLIFLITMSFFSYAFFVYVEDIGEANLPQKKRGTAVKTQPRTNTTLGTEAITKKSITYAWQLNLTNELRIALKKAEEKEYIILMWESPFGQQFNATYTNSSQCGKCLITLNKTTADDPRTKVIIFHFNRISLTNLPKNRRQDQLYVWFTMESSPALLELRNLALTEFDNFFNLTASYRRDSDVYWPYGTLEDIWYYVRQNGLRNPQKDIDLILSNKTGLAVWIVSNCKATRGAVKRFELVNKLVGAGLNVDRYGRCFPKNEFNNSDKSVIKNYKFYLSFENSFHCADYITEKLFHNGFVMGAVPVVWGAKKSDYLAAIPPHSFIYADDFSTPASLVKYLNYLDKNDTAYREYFAWRTKNVTEMPQYGRKTGYCQLCRIIHGINVDNVFSPKHEKLQADIPMFGHSNKPRIVPSLRKWYYETESFDCLARHRLKSKTTRQMGLWIRMSALLIWFLCCISSYGLFLLNFLRVKTVPKKYKGSF